MSLMPTPSTKPHRPRPPAPAPRGTTAERAAATTADPRWAALRARDATADGTFVYAVATTGVYCHPSCGARPARPENVSFHASAADAEGAGFRACRRCRADRPPRAALQGAVVAELCRLIDASDEPPPLDALARHAGLSPHHLHRVFKATTGLTPRQYAAGARQARARDALTRGAPVTAAFHGAGYVSSGRFYAEAAQALGMTPSRFRRGAPEETIRHAIASSSLGLVLVARAERGVCAILLGDDPATLVADLARRFPRAELEASDATFQRELAEVVALIEEPARGLTLPLDLRGTTFQRRVWAALAALPCGTTTTYAALAASLGAPSASRAVAGACAANPLAVAIPCHRVVRADGDLSGYRWGLDRKRHLLARESASPGAARESADAARDEPLPGASRR